MLIRRGTNEDARAIGEVFLASRARMTYLPRLHSDERTLAWIAHVVLAECEVWVAEDAGHIVGFAALSEAWLDHLYVAPGHQSAGIGTALLDKATRARAGTLHLRVFEQNEAAVRFYERHGFTLVERGDGGGNEERLPELHYRRHA